MQIDIHQLHLGFSVNTLSRNCPSYPGLKVEGTIAYCPGIRRNLVATSLVLAKVRDLAVLWVVRKKSVSSFSPSGGSSFNL